VTWEFSADCACVQNIATQEKGLQSNANIYPPESAAHCSQARRFICRVISPRFFSVYCLFLLLACRSTSPVPHPDLTLFSWSLTCVCLSHAILREGASLAPQDTMGSTRSAVDSGRSSSLLSFLSSPPSIANSPPLSSSFSVRYHKSRWDCLLNEW
jgi:hypothetical protein